MKNCKCKQCGIVFKSVSGQDTEVCPECGGIERSGIKIEAGFQIKGYELQYKIGAGAMGEVWLARQTAMDRNVAVKILSPSVCSRIGFVKRFQEEIKNSAKLDHINIIPAFDAGYENGLYYLVSAYVEGENLEQKLNRQKKVPETDALKIMLGISEALSYAWSEFNMLHRDIKPSNIIIDKKGVPKLMDMGLSKCVNEDPSLTYDGEVVGTPYYMSPEQAKGKKRLDLRSDIYSLGASLYHIVTGQTPFTGDSSVGILTKHITDPLIPPISRCRTISGDTNGLILRMMAKFPDKRLQTWYEVIGELRRIISLKEEAAADSSAETNKEEQQVPSDGASKPLETAGSNLNFNNEKQGSNRSVIEERNKNDNRKGAAKKICFFVLRILILSSVLFSVYILFLRDISLTDVSMIKFYNSLEKGLERLFGEFYFFAGKTILNNENLMYKQPDISFKLIGIELGCLLLMMFSGFWSGAKAQNNNKNIFLHFIGGLLLPFIYPLFIFNINNREEKNKDKIQIPEKKIIKFFKKAADKNKEVNLCFEFELYDGSRIYAERVAAVKNNMLVLQVYTETGDSKIRRIPYSGIKNCTKL
ncbi:MAG: serine/threonine protein kinase [Victivallales bacterium]|nr:serine/threonine protein kinase [Victivallales bacterium]MCF7889224.1 serine/threonine protein kinase [Victivallales bacterium]